MPMDTPLILTHDHDPKVVFRGQFNPYVLDTLQAHADPPSYNDLWTNFQHLSRTYNDLVSQHHDLSDAHQALQVELNNFRDSCWSLRSRQQELVDDATKARIQSWRHIVRVEELEKELGTLRHGETHLGSSKRKFADIENGDNDGARSDWSASTRSQSQSPSIDALATPASGSSKIASAPPMKDDPSEEYISFSAQLISSSCKAPQQPSSEIRIPKRRRECKTRQKCSRVSATDAQRQCCNITPIGKTSHQDTSPETKSKCTPHALRTPPQTRSTTRSSRRKRPSVIEQNTTAAAVAAALSEAAVHRRDSPSLGERSSLRT